MEDPSEGEGRRDSNSLVTSVPLAQTSLTSGRTGGGEGQRRETPHCRLPWRSRPSSSGAAAALLPPAFRSLHNPLQKKKPRGFRRGCFSPNCNGEKRRRSRGRASGRARAGEVQGHVTDRAPPPHHVGDQPRPNPQWAGETKWDGRGAGDHIT